MKRATAALLLTALLAGPAAAQDAPTAPRVPRAPEAPRATAAPYDDNFRETQRRFSELLRQYPPTLSQVLRLDPTILTNKAYLEPYPALAAFVAQHPEIARNPGFFLGDFRFQGPFLIDREVSRNVDVRDIFFYFAFLTGFVAVVATIGWLVRTLIEHRRWLRLSKVQTEAHAKLLDRLTSNEDLLAYIQSSPGRKFLESAPIPVSFGSQPFATPIGRILWTVQAGLVVGFGGAGLLYVGSRVNGGPNVSAMQFPLFAVGTVVAAVGAGFVVSAVVAYWLSRRLGLLAPVQPGPAEAGAGSPGPA